MTELRCAADALRHEHDRQAGKRTIPWEHMPFREQRYWTRLAYACLEGAATYHDAA